MMSTGVIGAFVAIGILIGAVLVEVAKGLLAKEAETRIIAVPEKLVMLAGRLLPQAKRERYVREWKAELHHIGIVAEGLPLTRLLRGLRFGLGVVRAARQITVATITTRAGRGLFKLNTASAVMLGFTTAGGFTRWEWRPTQAIFIMTAGAAVATLTSGAKAVAGVSRIAANWSTKSMIAVGILLPWTVVGAAGLVAKTSFVPVLGAAVTLVLSMTIAGWLAILGCRVRRRRLAAAYLRQVLVAIAPSMALASLFFWCYRSSSLDNTSQMLPVVLTGTGSLLTTGIALLGALNSSPRRSDIGIAMRCVVALASGTLVGLISRLSAAVGFEMTDAVFWSCWAAVLVVSACLPSERRVRDATWIRAS